MAGYKVQGKDADSRIVDLPLAATFDDKGNNISDYYAAKAEVLAKIIEVEKKINAVSILNAPTFANASWEQIDKYSQSGLAKVVWNVGDEKSITLSTGEEITMIILDFDHDDLSNGGKAGISLGMKNCLSEAYKINRHSPGVSINGRRVIWETTSFRMNELDAIYDSFPDDVKSIMKPVNKYSTYYDYELMQSVTVTTSDKLFLFSTLEVFGDTRDSNGAAIGEKNEGEQYKYFKNAPIPKPNSGTGEFLSTGNGCFFTIDESVATGYTNRFNQLKKTVLDISYNYNYAKGAGNAGDVAINWWLRTTRAENLFQIATRDGYMTALEVASSPAQGICLGFCV